VPGSALLFGKEWCYTTDGRDNAVVVGGSGGPLNFGAIGVLRDNRVPCANDDDCCLSWKCHSTCTV
jgi:hypothetical protein